MMLSRRPETLTMGRQRAMSEIELGRLKALAATLDEDAACQMSDGWKQTLTQN